MVTASAAGSSRPGAVQFSGEGMPDGPGKDTTVRVCGICHEPRRAAALRLTRDGWTQVVDDMVKRGARATDDERVEIVDYLTEHFLGESPRPINLNTAPSIDLESVVGLLRSEARRLIAYREKNGPCKTIEDFKNIEGVDFAKLEAARDRVVCY